MKYEVREEFASIITENFNFSISWSKCFLNFVPKQVALVLGRVIIWAAYDAKISKLMDLNIVARIKSFIPSTESIIKLSVLNRIVADNEGKLLIKESIQGNNNNINSRISGS